MAIAGKLGNQGNRYIVILDYFSEQVVKVLKGHREIIDCVAFSPDGNLLISGSADRTARLWDLESGKTLFVLSGHRDKVRALAFSPDGTGVGRCDWGGVRFVRRCFRPGLVLRAEVVSTGALSPSETGIRCQGDGGVFSTYLVCRDIWPVQDMGESIAGGVFLAIGRGRSLPCRFSDPHLVSTHCQRIHDCSSANGGKSRSAPGEGAPR